jgi:aldose 1-epimerase
VARFDVANGLTKLSFDAAHGGRVAQVWFDDVPLLVDEGVGVDPVLGWGSYPMVPWAGRLRNGRFQFRRDVVTMPANERAHAMHGLGFVNEWEVVGSGTSSLVARLDLDRVGWPFKSWCEQRISLGPDSVHLEMSVHGTERDFPAQVGWHPWFRTPTTLDVAFSTMFERDDDGITTTTTRPPTDPPWDDCFTDASANPRLVVNGVEVRLASTCRYWVVYTGNPNGICVEPQSGPPDAFNTATESGLDIVGTARVLQHSFTWTFSR